MLLLGSSDIGVLQYLLRLKNINKEKKNGLLKKDTIIFWFRINC